MNQRQLLNKILIAIAFAIFVAISGCKVDEIYRPIESKEFHMVEWKYNREKLFFDVYNSGSILNKPTIHNRSNDVPEFLIDIYNKIAHDNEVDSFVYKLSTRIGYPLWFESRMEDSRDSLPEIMYIPFSFKDTNEISAYLIAFRNSSVDTTIKLEFRLRSEIDSIAGNLKPYGNSTCHDVVRFVAFDSILYNVPTSTYDSLLIYACTASDDMFNVFGEQIQNRSCVSEIVEMCVWINDGTGNEGIGGGYADWVYDNDGTPDGFVWPGGGGGGGGVGGGSAWIFWEFINKGDQIVFVNPLYFFTNPDEIKNRTLILVCSDYLVIRCERDGWWETVAEIPCDGCDVQENTEKQMEAYCRSKGIDFISQYGITGTEEMKFAMMAANSCCNDFMLDDVCALINFINAAGGLDTRDNIPLNSCEIALVASYPGCAAKIYANKIIAEGRTVAIFGYNGEDDCTDAFRHTFFNALNAQACGPTIANQFGVAHECFMPSNARKTMDLDNNQFGQDLEESYGVFIQISQIEADVCSLLSAGVLRVLDEPGNPTSNIIDSDGCTCY